MSKECNYSFEMLYTAAFGKKLSNAEKLRFQNATQDVVNQLVLDWTKKAGWQTFWRKGLNGEKYLAFYP